MSDHTQVCAAMQNHVNDADLIDLVSQVLSMAKQQGATAAEVASSVHQGYSVNVRLGQVETVEYNRDKGIALSVYYGQNKGSASTSDTSLAAIQQTLEAACAIAKVTQADPCAGLADPDRLAKSYPQLDLYHPWSLTVADAIELATHTESLGLDCDPLLQNSEGASVNTAQHYAVYGNSHGFTGAYATTRHSLSCVLLAGQQAAMERDYAYTTARDANDLQSAQRVAKRAAERTLRRLKPRRLRTEQVPVIFESDIAGGLIGCFISAIRGSNLYRRSSFLLDQLGQKVFPSWMQIENDPFIMKGLGSTPYDNEGVAVRAMPLIKDGVLQSYLLSSYSARKLGLETTGHAGGAHNLIVSCNQTSLQDMIASIDRGFLVTELMGHGINLVTGDYSRGASGLWIENGRIAYPVSEVTIAGNLRDMLAGIVGVGHDLNPNSAIACGSIMVDKMMIAGM